MKKSGEITYIIYDKGQNNFKVFCLADDESQKQIKVAGEIMKIRVGMRVEVEGEFKKDKYGETFKASVIKEILPTTSDDLVSFLSSGAIPGIGPATAAKIVEKFGDRSVDVLSNPMELIQVSGISHGKANLIANSYKEIYEMRDLIMLLNPLGITNRMIYKIYEAFGASSVNIIKADPYRLIGKIDRVGFKRADAIAMVLGIPLLSDSRIEAGILYTIENYCSSGSHTYIKEKDLFIIARENMKNESIAECELEDKIKERVEKLLQNGQIFSFKKNNEKIYMLMINYFVERKIAENINKLMLRQEQVQIDLDHEIELYENTYKVTFHESQKEAIRSAIENGIVIITGGPGVGKTTIIKCIITIFKNLRKKVALCAPTGRAAKRMEEASGVEAKTIHRLLEYKWKNDSGSQFSRDENNPIDADVVIVDEMSMTDEYIFNSLLKAVKIGTRLILVGDKDQLQSVGCGNVLADLIECEKIKTAYLTHIYRQSDGNKIAENAHLINEGKMPNLNNEHDSGFYFVEKENEGEIADVVVNLVTKRLPENFLINPKDIQVLSATKKRYAGTENLNILLRDIINPDREFSNGLDVGGIYYRPGDKVMQMVNNYQPEEVGVEKSDGIYNGDMGFIESVDPKNRTIDIRFDDRLIRYRDEALYDFSLAYATTIHKSQGSEFDTLVIALAKGYGLTRNMLYTAVTRAKKNVVIISTKKTIAMMINDYHHEERNTLLKELIRGQIS